MDAQERIGSTPLRDSIGGPPWDLSATEPSEPPVALMLLMAEDQDIRAAAAVRARAARQAPPVAPDQFMPVEPNATCAGCGRVAMPFEGYLGE